MEDQKGRKNTVHEIFKLDKFQLHKEEMKDNEFDPFLNDSEFDYSVKSKNVSMERTIK